MQSSRGLSHASYLQNSIRTYIIDAINSEISLNIEWEEKLYNFFLINRFINVIIGI